VKINLLWIGKTRNSSLQNLIGDYWKRLSHFGEVSLIEIRSVQDDDPNRLVTREGEKILAKIEPEDFLILLDSQGRVCTSEEFAKLVSSYRDRSLAKLVFVIGGHHGVSPAVRNRSNLSVSLSRMTFNHEMVRLFLLEQIYRAFTIINRIPYHK
jgi:23S rRNA (pseudouridine1915-N3)-methyltransferase